MFCLNQKKRCFALGPGFTEAPPTLQKYLPVCQSNSPIHAFVNPGNCQSFKKLRCCPWPSTKSKLQLAWNKWVDKLETDFGKLWHKTGIYDLIQFSKVGVPFNPALINGAIRFWNPNSNVLCLPWGMMSPTLLDVCLLTGLLPAISTPVHAKLRHPDAAKLSGYCLKAFGHILGDMESFPLKWQHHCFLAVWLNRYVFCTKSLEMTPNYYHLACLLADGTQIDLASVILSCLYKSLYELRVHPEKTIGGPMWLFILWLENYFPAFKNGYTDVAIPDQTICRRKVEFSTCDLKVEQIVETLYESHPDISAIYKLLTPTCYHPSFGSHYKEEANLECWTQENGMRQL